MWDKSRDRIILYFELFHAIIILIDIGLEKTYAAHLFLNCNKFFKKMAKSEDQNSRPKLVISKAVRKYIKYFLL